MGFWKKIDGGTFGCCGLKIFGQDVQISILSYLDADLIVVLCLVCPEDPKSSYKMGIFH